MNESPAMPPVVSADEWQQARDELLVAEKEVTRALDALAARRRRLPMKPIANDYVFDGPDGKVTLLDLFQGRRQLVVYQFMDAGPDAYCPGCTWFTDGIPAKALSQLAGWDVSWATVSDMPLAQIESYKREQGWTVPFVSSRGTTFAEDCGVLGFQLSVFLRDGDDISMTYATISRGVDRLIFVNSVLDLMPYGRQQAWEDSPEGWPKRS